MIEDDFFATLKLKTGEELFAKVSATDEGDQNTTPSVTPYHG